VAIVVAVQPAGEVVVEAVVGADVIVEIHASVEVGVAVPRVLHECVAGRVGLAVEVAGAADAAVLGAAEHAERGVVVRNGAGGGGGDAVAGPGAAGSGGANAVDHLLLAHAAGDHQVVI